jgi:putative oxidoreductase
MRMRKWLFDKGIAGPTAADAGLLVLRLTAGLMLALLHGLGKVPPSDGFVGRVGGMGFPAPLLFAWLAAIAEFFGGLLLAVGLLTRPVGVFVFLHFLAVVFIAHAGDPVGRRELAMLFGLIALVLSLTGPGRYSLDAAISGRTDSSTGPARR